MAGSDGAVDATGEAAYGGFVPAVPPGHEPFWESVRRHRLALQRCDACRRFRFIPSERCTCGSPRSTWTEVRGTGEVYTYTVVHRAPTPWYQERAPYAIAHVTLDEGPRLIGTVVGCEPGAVAVGMPVEVVYDDVAPELTLYRWRPRSTP